MPNQAIRLCAQSINRLSSHKRFSFGFTLIELVIVILIVSVLAIAALPKFFNSGFSEQTLANELIVQLRHIQLKNMHSANSECYWLAIEPTEYQPLMGCNTLTPTAKPTPLPPGVNITTGNYRFNLMGQPIDNCDGGCTLTISGDETHTITIESEGYIHE